MFGFGNKKARKEFLDDSSVAIVHHYGDNTTIDGRPAEEFDHIKGEYGELIIKLPGGSHTFVSSYRTTGSSVNFKTDMIESVIPLEAGHEYDLGIFEYSRAYLEQHKDDPKMHYVYCLPLQAAAKEFHIICFLNK